MKKLSGILLLLIIAISFSAPSASAAIGGACGLAEENDCAATGRECEPSTGQCIPTTNASGGSVNMEWLIYYADGIVRVVNLILVPILMAVAFIVFLYGVYKYFIYHGDSDTERATGRKYVLWGIIGFVIITSVWGLVNIIKTTVIPSSAGSNRPAYPTL